MAFTDQLQDAIAEYAAGAGDFDGVGVYWDPNGYADDAPGFGIFIESFSQQDIRQIKLRSYTLAAEPALSESQIGVEFGIKGAFDPDEVARVRDGLFDLFHGMWSVTLGTTKVVMCNWSSESTLGPDGSGRVSQTVTYTFTVHRPSQNRT